jgi:hypothetical protein
MVPIFFIGSNAPMLTLTGEIEGTVVGVAMGDEGQDERQ